MNSVTTSTSTSGFIDAQLINCFPNVQQFIPYAQQYIHVHADVAIDKVQNGYVVTIAGKRFIAETSLAIASLIDTHSK